MQSSSSLQGAAADGRDRADEISFGKRRDRNLRPHGLRPAILDGEAEEERRAEQQQEAGDALAIVFHCGFTLRLRVGSRQVEADCDALNLFQRFGASRHRG
jgi:hypothetical protein